MNKLIGSIAVAFLLSACTDYLSEYKDEYDEEFAEGTISSSEPDETSSDGKTVSSSSAEETSSESAKSSSSSGKGTSSSSGKASSSSEKVTSSSSAKSSSSVKASSSSGKSESSSSTGTASSSSEVPPFGTCSATQSVAELGANVVWTFTWNTGSGLSVQDITSATYDWTLEGGTPATATKTSATTTYSTSGQKTASISVTTRGITQKIDCTPVNVNGAPITGCMCVGTNLTPDVSQGEQASWTLSGCKTIANIIGYTWTGATADATGVVATAPVSAKGDRVTGVSVKVANDDNSIVTVTCEDAVAIDASSPSYELRSQDDEVALPAGTSTVVMNLPEDWHVTTEGNCLFACAFGAEPGSGTVAGVALKEDHYTTASIPVSMTIGGYELEVTLTGAASCEVQW